MVRSADLPATGKRASAKASGSARTTVSSVAIAPISRLFATLC